MDQKFIDDCIGMAEIQYTKLSSEILSLNGMSGTKGRILLNGLASKPETRYCEIGSWKGSTICSAAYLNSGVFYAIDNFSEFGGPRQELLANIAKFVPYVRFVEGDCFQQELIDKLPKFNVYFYDGAHKYEDQKNALVKYYDKLDDRFLLIVDDFVGQEAQNGTYDAIEELNLKIETERLLGCTVDSDPRGYWCGMGVFILEKEKL